MLTDTEIAVGVHYVVHLDEQDLGDFSSCEGLGVEVVLASREEGGNNGFVWQFPTRLKYPNVKLTRPVSKKSADKILNWVVAAVSGFSRGTGHIEVKTADGQTVALCYNGARDDNGRAVGGYYRRRIAVYLYHRA